MRGLFGVCLAGLLLAGCASTASGTGVSADAVAQYQALANGVLSIAGTEAGIAGASPAVVARVNSDAALAQSALAALSPGMQAAAAAPTLQTIETAVNDVLLVAQTLPLPPPAQQIELALQVLLPVAEAALNPAAPAAGAVGGMTPQQALQVLQQAQR